MSRGTSSADPSIAPFVEIASSADDLPASVPQRYLALLADVAERLLAADGSASMVDELFDLIRQELRLDVFFNYRVEHDRLVLEAHGGLTDAEARDGAELTLGQAVCGCVARDRRPVHAIGVQSSDDPLHAFVKRMGLDAYACTPLLHAGRLLGTLGFGRRWADRFTPDEIRFLSTVCHYVALAKYRLRVEAELRDGVIARERLLIELNHRVRNALQVAVGLVAVELSGVGPEARAALQRAVDRLQVLALAHRPLYAGGQPDAIDPAKLLAGVIEGGGDRIHAGTLGAAPPIPVETAAALALLVHVVLAARSGTHDVTIDAAMTDAGLAVIFVGLDSDGETAAPPDRRMTAALLHQLRAELHSEPSGMRLMLPYPRHD